MLNIISRLLKVSCVILLTVFILSCSSNSKKTHAENVCRVFLHNPSWLWATEKAQQRWQVPMSLLMAIIFQESSFRSNAEPKRSKLLHYIPWLRASTAIGYAQATNETWRTYCRNRNLVSADRSSFTDAIDFVAWYISYAHHTLHIPKNDPYSTYLAYHEGIHGYAHGSYRHKFWLKHIARKVKKRAYVYHQQLLACMHQLPRAPWWY